jgi:hypothetical protein
MVAMSPPTIRRRRKITTEPAKADAIMRARERQKTRNTKAPIFFLLQMNVNQGGEELRFLSSLINFY